MLDLVDVGCLVSVYSRAVGEWAADLGAGVVI